MKTLLAALIALGTFAGAANAQHVRFIGHGYNAGPVYCAPEHDASLPEPRHHRAAGCCSGPAGRSAGEAPAEAAPEAPADDAAPLQAPLPPK